MVQDVDHLIWQKINSVQGAVCEPELLAIFRSGGFSTEMKNLSISFPRENRVQSPRHVNSKIWLSFNQRTIAPN